MTAAVTLVAGLQFGMQADIDRLGCDGDKVSSVAALVLG